MKEFGSKRPVRNEAGDVIDLRDAPARRMTRHTLGFAYGPDRDRKLVVSLEDGDLIKFRPLGTRRVESVSAADVYHWVIRSKAQAAARQRATEKKARHSERLARRRQEAAERRLFKEAA